MLTYDQDTRCWAFVAGDWAIPNWRVSVEVDGILYDGSEAQGMSPNPANTRLTFPAIGLTWTLTAAWDERAGCLLVRSELRNDGQRSLSLGKVTLLHADGPIYGEADSQRWVCLPLSGDLHDRRVFWLDDPDCPRRSKVEVQFYNRPARVALQVGFVTFLRANTEVSYSADPDAGLVRLRAWCDLAGWQLEPGCTTPTETFCLMVGNDPHAQLQKWADLAAERCAPRRWADPPIGWIGWAWVDPFTVERYQDVVLRNCEAIRRRLAGFGVEYVWVSVGNLTGGVPGDWQSWNDDLFPGGPQLLASRLREMGFKWGLWCGAFWICASASNLDRLADALLVDDDGTPMVVRPEWQFGDAGTLPRSQRPCMYALDPSHPQALAFLREVFETYRRWGVRYYMLDFLEAGAGNISRFPYHEHHDKSLVAGPEVYHHALRVIREAAGDDTYFLSSTGPSVHNAGIMDAIRTGTDFGEGRALYPDSYFYPATYVISGHGYWTGPQKALLNQAAAYYTHRKLYINDSGNVLTVDKPLPLNDARIHATVHAMGGGPSMLGDDIDRIDEERLRLIKVTLPRSRDVAMPIDLFDSIVPNYPKVFHRRIDRHWGRFDVVAVYNFDPNPMHLSIALPVFGLRTDAVYLVWEFWNGELADYSCEILDARVPPGEVKVYRLVEDRGVPVLLGTDMHLLMGEVEISDCRWDAGACTLGGRAIRPAGESGNLFIYVPPAWRVANPAGLWIAKDARTDALIVRVALSFDHGYADWSVGFVKREKY